MVVVLPERFVPASAKILLGPGQEKHADTRFIVSKRLDLVTPARVYKHPRAYKTSRGSDLKGIGEQHELADCL